MGQHILVKEPGAKPERGVIETDHAIDVQGCFLVIPGAGMLFFQKLTCPEFGQENTDGINAASQKEWFPFQKSGQWFQKYRHSIDGKHPKGCISFQPNVMIFHCAGGRVQDLEAPAEKSARKEFFHHMDSMSGFVPFIQKDRIFKGKRNFENR